MALRSRRADDPADDDLPQVTDEGMTLTEHLTELRQRLVKAIIALAIGGVIGFLLYSPVLRVLQAPYCEIQPEGCAFIVTDPLQSF